MHLILASMGTDGDILPFIGLGAIMRGRGHRVTFAAPGQYEALATRHGLGFTSLMSESESQEMIGDPDFWHPVKGPLLATRFSGPLMERQYVSMTAVAVDEDCVIVSHPGVAVAPVLAEKLGRPLATVILQPWFVKSSIAPPVLPGVSLRHGLPRWVGAIYWRLWDAMGDVLIGPSLNRLRKTAGLPKRRRILEHLLSRELTIGMFPQWYGQPQADWRICVRCVGFARFDGTGGAELDSEVLEFCEAGTPPAVFSFGTGFRHAGGVFESAIDACRIAGVRAIFLTKYPEQLPRDFPHFIRAWKFAPFRALFPRCSVVVHHGGVGTMAEAFAAGVPQLILPIAWDQEDNATRVKKLGAGEWLKPKRRRPRDIAGALASAMRDDVKTRCAQIASWFKDERPLDEAANAIEEWARGHGL